MNTKIKNNDLGVYKFRHKDRMFYRYGRNLNDAITRLARELKVEVIYIEILERGEPQ